MKGVRKWIETTTREREREREREHFCHNCQKKASKLVTNICVYCHKWGDNKEYCEECFRPVGSNGEINPNEECPNKKLQEHQDECKKSERVKKDIQEGYWNCQICKENLWEKESWSPNCSCPIEKHHYIRLCVDKHGEKEISQLMDKIHQKNQIKSDEEITNKETEKLEPNQTIYYACPHNEKMTEPNCQTCLVEAEEELKTEGINYNSLTRSIAVNFCSNCGMALKSLNGYYYRHQGMKTNIQKQIKTEHCKPEQIAEYQKGIKEDERKKSKQEEKEYQQIPGGRKEKAQKQQNFLLWGIFVSLIILIGIGLYFIFQKKSKNNG